MLQIADDLAIRTVERGSAGHRNGKKVLVSYITNIPSLYRADMLDAWSSNDDIELSVYYTNTSDQGRGWATRPSSFATEKRLPVMMRLGRWGHLNWNLLEIVCKCDVLMIGGFEEASYMVSALLANILQKPVVLLSDGFSPARAGREKFAIFAVKWIIGRLSTAFLVNGEAGRRHILTLGGSNRPIFNQFLCAHRAPFLAAKYTTDSDRESFRARLGFGPFTKIVLFCGYLIKRKRIDLCIDALANVSADVDVGFICVGSGPLVEILQQQASETGFRCVFPGFKEGSELARFYNASDIFVLPSDDDPWGLVVDEALTSGLTLVVSDACGCAFDLVQEGRTGFTFRHGDIVDAARAIRLASELGRDNVMARSAEFVEYWNTKRSGAEFASAIKAALQSKAHVNSASRLRELSIKGRVPAEKPSRSLFSLDVIVVHETDGRRYFEALQSMASAGELSSITFVEATVVRKFFRSLIRERVGIAAAFFRALNNAAFRSRMFGLSSKTIILGVAPWDYRFLLYSPLMFRNRVIYHTSWTSWDGEFVPRRYGYVTPIIRWAWRALLIAKDMEVVAVTSAAKRSISGFLSRDVGTVIPHVVSPEFFRRKATYSVEKFGVLFVGDLIPHKGIHKFSEIANVLAAAGAQFTIVGDGPLRGVAGRIAETRENVAYLGAINSREKMAEIMSDHQLLILPSQRTDHWEELLGMVVIEAMAAGLPVVASDHIGPTSIITDGQDGFLVPESGWHVLGDIVHNFKRDEALWSRMGLMAHTKAASYSISGVSELWRSLLRKSGGGEQ